MEAFNPDRFFVITYKDPLCKVRLIFPSSPYMRYRIQEVDQELRAFQSNEEKINNLHCRTYVFHTGEVDIRPFLIPENLGYFYITDVPLKIQPRNEVKDLGLYGEFYSILLSKPNLEMVILLPRGTQYSVQVADFLPNTPDNLPF